MAGSRVSQNKNNKHKSKNVTNKDMQNAWHYGKNVNINAVIGTLGTRPMARRWSNAPEVRAKLGNLQGFSSVNLSACSFVKFT